MTEISKKDARRMLEEEKKLSAKGPIPYEVVFLDTCDAPKRVNGYLNRIVDLLDEYLMMHPGLLRENIVESREFGVIEAIKARMSRDSRSVESGGSSDD